MFKSADEPWQAACIVSIQFKIGPDRSPDNQFQLSLPTYKQSTPSPTSPAHTQLPPIINLKPVGLFWGKLVKNNDPTSKNNIWNAEGTPRRYPVIFKVHCSAALPLFLETNWSQEIVKILQSPR